MSALERFHCIAYANSISGTLSTGLSDCSGFTASGQTVELLEFTAAELLTADVRVKLVVGIALVLVEVGVLVLLPVCRVSDALRLAWSQVIYPKGTIDCSSSSVSNESDSLADPTKLIAHGIVFFKLLILIYRPPLGKPAMIIGTLLTHTIE